MPTDGLAGHFRLALRPSWRVETRIGGTAALVKGWRSWRGAALDDQKPYG